MGCGYARTCARESVVCDGVDGREEGSVKPGGGGSAALLQVAPGCSVGSEGDGQQATRDGTLARKAHPGQPRAAGYWSILCVLSPLVAVSRRKRKQLALSRSAPSVHGSPPHPIIAGELS